MGERCRTCSGTGVHLALWKTEIIRPASPDESALDIRVGEHDTYQWFSFPEGSDPQVAFVLIWRKKQANCPVCQGTGETDSSVYERLALIGRFD